MKKAELRPNVFAQELSDMDGCERETPFGIEEKYKNLPFL